MNSDENSKKKNLINCQNQKLKHIKWLDNNCHIPNTAKFQYTKSNHSLAVLLFSFDILPEYACVSIASVNVRSFVTMQVKLLFFPKSFWAILILNRWSLLTSKMYTEHCNLNSLYTHLNNILTIVMMNTKISNSNIKIGYIYY